MTRRFVAAKVGETRGGTGAAACVTVPRFARRPGPGRPRPTSALGMFVDSGTVFTGLRLKLSGMRWSRTLNGVAVTAPIHNSARGAANGQRGSQMTNGMSRMVRR